ncbi:MAG: glycosyltransferase family 39 protein [Pseudomonadota bacterium]
MSQTSDQTPDQTNGLSTLPSAGEEGDTRRPRADSLPGRRLDLVVAGVLVAGTTAVLLATAPAQGVHRDEAYYMKAGEQYATYYEHALTGKLDAPLARESIARYWSYNSEHPPLMKLLYGLSWRLFHRCDCAEERDLHPGVARLERGRHRTLAFLSETSAFRLPTMVLFGLLGALVYLFFVEAFGSRVGAAAAALLTIAQPRAFFHASTASFDLPAATWWFATSYAYWRALEGGKLRALATGLLYGLFLSTKLQSFFLPFALGGHWLFLAMSRRRQKLGWPTPAPLIAMVVVGPLVFAALWPHLWHDTVRRLGGYLAFHWKHVHYNFEYLGHNFNRPPYPWHEPLGMLVTTAPVILLALALAGTALLGAASRLEQQQQQQRQRQRQRRRQTGDKLSRATWLLILLGVLVPMAPFFFGRTPIFGETKHWLATMPHLAILAGIAVALVGKRLAVELSPRPVVGCLMGVALAGVTAAPAVVETMRSHPYALSHYNALVGGAPGGAELGMNRQFWGYAIAGLLPWMNANLPPNTKLYLHDCNHDAFEMYRREHLIRPDIVDAGMEEPGVRASQAALVIHEKHFNKYEYMIWNAYGHVRPAAVLVLDGAPLVTLYLRDDTFGAGNLR